MPRGTSNDWTFVNSPSLHSDSLSQERIIYFMEERKFEIETQENIEVQLITPQDMLPSEAP